MVEGTETKSARVERDKVAETLSHIRKMEAQRAAGSVTLHFDGQGKPSKVEVKQYY